VVYRSALYELGLGVAAILATLTALVLVWRCGRRVRQGQRRTRAHAEAARITGRRLPEGVVVLDASRSAAYCVPGRPRPGTIVVTSGALAVLGPAQLTAVLAHERAHLAGRHHVLVALTRGLAAIFPWVPVFSRGSAAVARLTEMSADDAAARRAGRRPLIEALLALGTEAPAVPSVASGVPVTGLAAAGYAVAARLQRLLEPPSPASRARSAFALSGVLLALPAVSGLIFAFASSS
jgi:Zn-dependent protease with chaperone function